MQRERCKGGGVGSWESGSWESGSWESGVGSRELGVGSRELGVGSWESGVGESGSDGSGFALCWMSIEGVSGGTADLDLSLIHI